MQAIVLESFGKTDQFRMQDVPTPTAKAHEVRIQIKAVGFNPVDYKMRQGGIPTSLPAILGADCCGVIDQVGNDVKGFSKGDEVMAFVFGQGSNGCYAQCVCIDSSFITKKPKNISFADAAGIPLAALTAYRCFESLLPIKKDASVFIAGGSGGVGSIAIQLAACFGISNIFTTAGGKESVEYLVKELGILEENILLYRDLSNERRKEKLLAMNKGELFSIAIDLVGKEMKELCLSILDCHGHMVSIVPESKGFELDVWTREKSLVFAKSLSIHCLFVGSESYSGNVKHWPHYKRQLDHIAALIESHKIKIPRTTEVGGFSVESVKNAHELLEKGKVKGKLVMTL